MSEIVLRGFVEESDGLTQIVPPPAGPLGYGRDLSCVRDVTETADEVDEFSVVAIWEAALRRITTDRGSLPDGGDPEDGEYGWSVYRLLHRGLTPAEIRDAAGQLQSEISKDDRVRVVSVSLAQLSSQELRVEISIEPMPPLAPFSRTVAVTPDTVREL